MLQVKLDYPHEVLICISGYYGSINEEEKSKVIRSLTFYTSRGKYGPFGEEVGTYFTSTTTQGKVVGFHGRCSSYLDAIGVHMQHWLGNQKASKMSLFKIFSWRSIALLFWFSITKMKLVPNNELVLSWFTHTKKEAQSNSRFTLVLLTWRIVIVISISELIK